jgi:hypothetical protein
MFISKIALSILLLSIIALLITIWYGFTHPRKTLVKYTLVTDSDNEIEPDGESFPLIEKKKKHVRTNRHAYTHFKHKFNRIKK